MTAAIIYVCATFQWCLGGSSASMCIIDRGIQPMRFPLYCVSALFLLNCGIVRANSAVEPLAAINAVAPPGNAVASLPASNDADTSRGRLAELERRNQILEAKRELEDQAYAHFENLMTGLGLVITLLVVGFGIFTHRSAVSAARQEIADLKDKVRLLRDEAEAATAEALEAAGIAKSAAEGAQAHQLTAQEASERVREVVVLAERVRIADPMGITPQLSPAEREAVSTAAKEVEDKPEKEWSADEFRVKIVQANSEGDWDQVLRLARGMEFLHGPEAESLSFALFEQAWALGNLGRFEEELSLYKAITDRFQDAGSIALERRVAAALYNTAIRFDKLEERDKANGLYDDIIARYLDRREIQLEELVAKSLVNKAFNLAVLDKSEHALSINEEVLTRYSGNEEIVIKEQVVMALFNKGVRLEALGRNDEALETFTTLVLEYRGSTDPEILLNVARALVNKGALLNKLDRIDEELDVHEEVLKVFGDRQGGGFDHQLAMTLSNKALTLQDLSRYPEALATHDDILLRFAHSKQADLQQYILVSAYSKARIFGRDRKIRACIGALDQWKDLNGQFDCEKVAKERDFDPVRKSSLFARYLRRQGCEV